MTKKEFHKRCNSALYPENLWLSIDEVGWRLGITALFLWGKWKSGANHIEIYRPNQGTRTRFNRGSVNTTALDKLKKEQKKYQKWLGEYHETQRKS